MFWRIFQIVEYKIFVQYFFPGIPQEILNMLESSLNQKIVRILYISKIYSILGELIDHFKCPSLSKPYSQIGNNSLFPVNIIPEKRTTIHGNIHEYHPRITCLLSLVSITLSLKVTSQLTIRAAIIVLNM